MKKAFVLILVATLIITAFAGCNSNSIKQKLSGKEPQTIASNAEGGLVGGWLRADSPEISDRFKSVFAKATETLTGVEYTPVAYIASQIVAGRNHCVLCTAKATVPDAEECYVILHIYEDLQGNAAITEVYENSEAEDSVFFDGMWTETESPVITADVKAAFDKATETLTGVGLTPIALVATKLENGYCILCEETYTTPDTPSDYALVMIINDSYEESVVFDRGTADNSVEIANPVAGYQTLEEAENAVGFDISVPADIKELINFSVIGGSLLEIDFKGGYMRKAKGTDDISGDYNAYTDTQKLTVGNITYTLKGDGKTVSLAVWTDGGYTYCLHFDKGAAQGDMLKYISEIK